MLEFEASDRIRANRFRGRQINVAVGNLRLHHCMNRQGNDRKSGAAQDGEYSEGFGEHELWVGADATLLNSTLIPDDTGHAEL